MILVEICGGLGNQLFQYALARKLKEIGKEVYLDLSWFDIYTEREYMLDKYFLSVVKTSNKIDQKRKMWSCVPLWRRRHIYTEKPYSFDADVFKIDNVILKGYWQSDKYFGDIREILLEELIPDFAYVSEYCKDMCEKIEQCCSVSVHIRRGDYLIEQNREQRDGICTERYYQRAMDMLRNKCKGKHVHFYFFSDDMKWVKQNYAGNDVSYVDTNNDAPYEEIWLMSRCKHNIIANSSFSWWGAWLNCNEKRMVIAPSSWKNGQTIENIYCADWIRIRG